MKFSDKLLVIEAREINALLVSCVRVYLFHHKNVSPEKIRIEQISGFDFKYDAASKAEHIPVEFIAKETKANDDTNRLKRARRNRKATKPVSSSIPDESEPDTKS